MFIVFSVNLTRRSLINLIRCSLIWYSSLCIQCYFPSINSSMFSLSLYNSRYGEIVHINLIRDKDSGKSKGFGFICYEDQRSTILAVDNLNTFKVCKTYYIRAILTKKYYYISLCCRWTIVKCTIISTHIMYYHIYIYR